MFARILYLAVALLFGAVEVDAQPVTVIGPVTPGNCAMFNSTTVIKDAGGTCGGGGGGGIPTCTVAGSFPIYNVGQGHYVCSTSGNAGNQAILLGDGTGGAQLTVGTSNPGGNIPTWLLAGSGFPPFNLIETALDGVVSLNLNENQQTFYAMGTDAGYAWFTNVGSSSQGPGYAFTLAGEQDPGLRLIISNNSFKQDIPGQFCADGCAISTSPVMFNQYWTYFTVDANNNAPLGKPAVKPGVAQANFTGLISGNTLTAHFVTGSIYVGQALHAAPVAISSGTYNAGTGAVSLTLASSAGMSPGQQVLVLGATGTGTVNNINGAFTTTAGTSGTTVNYTVAPGQTMTITGSVPGGGAQAQMDSFFIVGQNPTTIVSGSYNSGTGIVSLTTSVPLLASPGQTVSVTGATGTGADIGLVNGNFTAAAGSGGGGGTIVTYSIGTGKTVTSITAANVILPGQQGFYKLSRSITLADSTAFTTNFAGFDAALAISWNYWATGETDFVNDTNGHGPSTVAFSFTDFNFNTNVMTQLVKINSASNSAPGVLVPLFGIGGVTDGTVAPCAGCVGEYISSELTSGQAFTINAVSPFQTWVQVASVTLTAGDWDVSGNVGFCLGAGLTCGAIGPGNVNIIAASIDTIVGGPAQGVPASAAQFASFSGVNTLFNLVNFPTVPVGPVRYTCVGTNCNNAGNGTNNIKLNGYCGYGSAGTFSCAAYGKIIARRRR